MDVRAVATLALVSVLTAPGACGGKLGDRSKSQDRNSDRDGTGGQGEDNKAGQAGADDGLLSNRALEACKLGFSHLDEPGKACPYITDDRRCYDTPEAACDCACPREGSPNCVRYVFLDPIEVTCDSL
jgi:hypothetical protein